MYYPRIIRQPWPGDVNRSLGLMGGEVGPVMAPGLIATVDLSIVRESVLTYSSGVAVSGVTQGPAKGKAWWVHVANVSQDSGAGTTYVLLSILGPTGTQIDLGSAGATGIARWSTHPLFLPWPCLLKGTADGTTPNVYLSIYGREFDY